MMNTGVKAQCKVCNGFAPADQFKLHHSYKLMVCPTCFSGKTEKRKQEEVKKEGPSRPPGWDQEDEYLEKMSRMRQKEQQTQFTRIPGSDMVQCVCTYCKFSFKYDHFKGIPKACPYCNINVPKFKKANLL